MRSFFLLLLLIITHNGFTDVIYEKLDSKDYRGRQLVSVTIANEINEGDYIKLKDILNEINLQNYRLKEDSIYLNSIGGSINQAKNMGHLIRKHHIATKVKKDGTCESACIFILVSGSCRMALGYVGVHRSRSDFNYRSYDEMQRMIPPRTESDHEFLKKMGTSEDLIDATDFIPAWTMRFLEDKTKLKAGLYVSPEFESNYWQEVVSRKIAAPKSFLLETLMDRSFELMDSVSWYEEKILKKDPNYIFPSCTEQMFLDQLEKYSNGTDRWDEQFELYNSWSGYHFFRKDGGFDTYYLSDVPLIDGVSHYWAIEYFKKGAKTVTYTEETILSKPTEWDNGEESVTIDMNGRRATRKVTVPNNGTLTSGWALDPLKDPTGPMTVKIYVDNQLIKIFNYNIISKKQFQDKIMKAH